MIRWSSISSAALAGVCAACVFATTVAAEDQTTDIGTQDLLVEVAKQPGELDEANNSRTLQM